MFVCICGGHQQKRKLIYNVVARVRRMSVRAHNTNNVFLVLFSVLLLSDGFLTRYLMAVVWNYKVQNMFI